MKQVNIRTRGNLPDQIDGQDVIGTEDGFVIVDNLVLHSDSSQSMNSISLARTSLKRSSVPAMPNGVRITQNRKLGRLYSNLATDSPAERADHLTHLAMTFKWANMNF